MLMLSNGFYREYLFLTRKSFRTQDVRALRVFYDYKRTRSESFLPSPNFILSKSNNRKAKVPCRRYRVLARLFRLNGGFPAPPHQIPSEHRFDDGLRSNAPYRPHGLGYVRVRISIKKKNKILIIQRRLAVSYTMYSHKRSNTRRIILSS